MPQYKYKVGGKTLWYCSFHYKTWNGESKRKVKRGFQTRREAAEFEHAFLDHGHKDPTLLFATFIEEYLNDCDKRLKPTTVRTKRSVFSSKIVPYLGKMKLCDVDAGVVRKWQNALIDDDEGEDEFSQTYLRTIHAQLSASMNFAVKYYNLQKNPCHAAGPIGKGKADEMKIWSREQFEHFIQFEKKTSYRVAFNTLYYTGIREGELLALTPDDVLTEQAMLRVNKNYAVVDDIAMFLTPKTETSCRDVAIDKMLLQELNDYIDSMDIRHNERIFYFQKDGLLKEFHKQTKAAGLPDIRIHDLRHSHVALLISKHVPITDIAKRLGHASPRVTLSVYAHLYPGTERHAADMIEELRTNETEPPV